MCKILGNYYIYYNIFLEMSKTNRKKSQKYIYSYLVYPFIVVIILLVLFLANFYSFNKMDKITVVVPDRDYYEHWNSENL